MSRRKLILKKKTLNDEENIEVDKIEHDIFDQVADKEFDKLKRVLEDLNVVMEQIIVMSGKNLERHIPKTHNPFQQG